MLHINGGSVDAARLRGDTNVAAVAFDGDVR